MRDTRRNYIGSRVYIEGDVDRCFYYVYSPLGRQTLERTVQPGLAKPATCLLAIGKNDI